MKKSLISTKLKSSISSRVVVLSVLVLLVGFFVVGLSGRSVFQPSVTRPSGTTAHRAEQVVANELYTRLELANVENYAATSANNLVITSGTVVGIKVTPSQLVLGDGKGSYVLVIFARVDTDLFAPIFSRLSIGDTVEVRGMANVVQGVLVNSQDGATIEMVGVNLANAPYFGAISLTDITKIK